MITDNQQSTSYLYTINGSQITKSTQQTDITQSKTAVAPAAGPNRLYVTERLEFLSVDCIVVVAVFTFVLDVDRICAEDESDDGENSVVCRLDGHGRVDVRWSGGVGGVSGW